MKSYIQIAPTDNVVVILEPVQAGTVLEEPKITVMQDIPAGHKCAIRDIAEGEPVIKYGNPIGNAKEAIKAGSWVHTHNVKTGLSGQLTYSYTPVDAVKRAGSPGQAADAVKPADAVDAGNGSSFGTDSSFGTEDCGRTGNKCFDGAGLPLVFRGYRRKDGRAGIRNEIWILPTVGCVNHIAEALEAEFKNSFVPENVDAVVAMTHPYGCSQMGDDQENTALILGDMAKHPNCGGVLILSLGCENNNLDHMKQYLEGIDGERVRYLVCQNCEDEVEEGRRLIDELLDIAGRDTRTEIPVSELIVGLKCGGSDGFSGITANPLVGRFSDIITAMGGSSILTEVPEMFGAEQLLMNRAKDEAVFEKTVELINGFKDYYERHNQVIYENPSPGNKQGGITTLEDKSLGCVQKSGSAFVTDVLKYGERVREKGLNLLEGPGNDMVAVTALAAAGAHIILFTTGRGTPLSSPVPTVKISSNSALASNKKGWIDFDAGRAVSSDVTLDELGNELYRYVIDVASGRQVKSEQAGYHSMTIFKQGVTL